ncbi:proline-specific peptidase [Xylariaceae sp. AK1471]|nr:proline-specific peptidase [Xylariaceae sp. AK1471]
MVKPVFEEGRVPFLISSIDESCFTYYKIVGDLSTSAASPLIIVHGGPGVGHGYLLTFADLWNKYDQIGCGKSTHLPQTAGDGSFWQEGLFQDHLDLRSRGFHLLGHSWGGMLGAAFASCRPSGLQRLILANALASKELGLEEAGDKGEYGSDGYKLALVYYQKNYDPTVNYTMNGRSALTPGGPNSKWTVISRLPNIAVPTLVYNGDHDTSHDIAQVPFFEIIPRVRWIIFPDCGHMSHLEGRGLRERVLTVVGEFLRQESSDTQS